MLLSHLYSYAVVLCGNNAWQVDAFYPLMAWSYETGNYAICALNGQWVMCFYTFCNISDIEYIGNDYNKYVEVLLRKQVKGDVIIPYFVCGKIYLRYKDWFKSFLRDKKVKKILFYKSKIRKFYIMEV